MLYRHFLSLAGAFLLCIQSAGDVLSGDLICDQVPSVSVKSREELIQAVRASKPGSKILLAPGKYEGGLSFQNLKGTAEKPILIGAADPKNPPVFEGGASGLHFTAPAYVELQDLVITKSRGNGLNIDDGGSSDTPAHHVVLRRLVVRDTGSDGNHDGLKLSGLDDFVVEDCTVQRWGKRGSAIDMVGCHQGKILACTIREGDSAGANGIQMKGGSSNILVSRCRFEDAGGRAVNIGGSTGLPYFRPKPQGYEAKDITVSDCVFLGSMAPLAFVGVDGAVVEHNTFYLPTNALDISHFAREPSRAVHALPKWASLAQHCGFSRQRDCVGD